MAAAAHRAIRRLALVVVAGLAVAGLTFTMLLGPRSKPAAHKPAGGPTITAGGPSSSPTSPRSAPNSVGLPPLRRTDDPAAYAREVATALFDVDPAVVSRAEFLSFWQGELPTVVYRDGAVQGLTLAAQNADAMDNLTTGWIPPASAWAGEAADHTISRLRITAIAVPDYWVDAVAAGRFTDPGLHMERVTGVLTQTYGTDPARRTTSARAVVLDLGLLCGPTQPGGCRLLAPQTPPGTDTSGGGGG